MSYHDGLDAWSSLMEKYFSNDDAEQLEWAIGSVFSSEGPKKIVVVEGPAGSGKSTILKLVRTIVEDYDGERRSVDIRLDWMSIKGELQTAVMFVATNTPVEFDASTADRLIHIKTTTGNQHTSESYKTLIDLVSEDTGPVIDHCVSIYKENNR